MGSIIRALVNRKDLALWDGVTRTVTRVDTTGGSVTGLTLGDEVDVLQVFGGGTERTRATIADAVAYIGSNVVTLLFSTGTWSIDADVTVPSTMAVHVAAGCVFDISASKTLTLSGPVHVDYSASDGTGWYTGSGTISCSQGASGYPGW